MTDGSRDEILESGELGWGRCESTQVGSLFWKIESIETMARRTTLAIVVVVSLLVRTEGFCSNFGPDAIRADERAERTTSARRLAPDSTELEGCRVARVPITRREWIAGSAAAATTAFSALTSSPASARVVAAPSRSSRVESSPERDELLRALDSKSSNDVVMGCINKLLPSNPAKELSQASFESALDGEWKLLWYSTSEFSPLLKLPIPALRPDSYQYFGDVATREVGRGRVAQGLSGGVLSALGPGTQLWLSSGAVSKGGSPSTLEIYPPFRLQLGGAVGSGRPKRTIVEADSDADFRAVNGRSTEAQLAPKNEYEQLYMEDAGEGSLRISVITKGDPVIVGEMFVHQKI